MGAFYNSSVSKFLNDPTNNILGTLTQESGISGFFQQLHQQTLAWSDEINILKSNLQIVTENYTEAEKWEVLLEYPIARREKRIDVVIIAQSEIIVIEFKNKSERYSNDAIEQLMDYCLDLRDFHFESRHKRITPILLAPNASDIQTLELPNETYLQQIQYANKNNLAKVLLRLSQQIDSSTTIDPKKWNNSIYAPTPTIIEAAKTLYAGKSVAEISRSHAGTKNLTKTTEAVINAINKAKVSNEKIICFITGVPGAGKTLAGLNIAHHLDFQNEDSSLATFLSGNGPLIKVLREALTRDSYQRLKKENKDAKKKEQKRIIAFIENVHRFVDEYFFDKEKTPNNHIIIFDEAQRAWNAEHSQRKFNRNFSEPEMVMEIMNRHKDWSVIVALIGGGQEINTGEAGLKEWGKNILEKFNNWTIYVSPELKIGSHATGNQMLFDYVPDNVNIIEEKDLHLNVSIRSYKAENLSNWVSLILNNNPDKARVILKEHLSEYPVALTRDINKARAWLKIHCKGSRRMGLVASSGARRLRAHGLEVKIDLEEENWFLNPRGDIRSSNSLEVPATEFGIQGLELDWTGVCWDADLRRTNGKWESKRFRGTTWTAVNDQETHQYIINKYRVLLTRAREGMIIWVPEGDKNDPTRLPEFYDPIYEYLKSCGLSEL